MTDPAASVDPAAGPPLPSPDMVRFRDTLARAYAAHPPFAGLTVEQVRAVAEQVRVPWAAGGPEMAETRTLTVEIAGSNLRLRLHRPGAAPRGLLVYVHGGGWLLFSVDSHDRVMREYAARADLAVIGLDYSLSPEARFPRPVEEVAALIRLLRSGGLDRALGLDASLLPMAVAGDSAGGNLAMAAALTLRDGGHPDLLRGIVLNYAVVEPLPERASYRLFDSADYNLTADEMRIFWAGYAPEASMRADPRACLLAGPLAGLPPVLLAVAECDVLRDENLALADALHRAGVPVTATLHAGMLHSFLEAVSISPGAVAAFDEAAAWLRRVLGSPAGGAA